MTAYNCHLTLTFLLEQLRFFFMDSVSCVVNFFQTIMHWC